MFREKE